MKEYAVLVDLAKKRDFTAIMVMKDSPQIAIGSELLGQPNRVLHYYDIMYLNQRQGMQYHDIVKETRDLMQRAALAENAELIVDGTGVGEAVVEIMREQGLRPIPIITTGSGRAREIYADVSEVFRGYSWGDRATKLNTRILKEIHVPKSDLVAAGQLLVQQERVRVSSKLKWAEEAQKQFKSFRGKINERTKHKVYEAETEEEHDDIVICFLLGAWWFVKHRPQQEIPERELPDNEEKQEWDPYDFW